MRTFRLVGIMALVGLLGACGQMATQIDAQKAVDSDAPGPWNGTYAGVAINQDPAIPEQVCPQQIRMESFQVAGRYVVFGVYRGEIDPDGRVQIQYQNNFIWGQFGDGLFNGALRLNVRCIYSVRLAKQ